MKCFTPKITGNTCFPMVLCNLLEVHNTHKGVAMDRLKNIGLVLTLCHNFGENSNGFSILYEKYFYRDGTHIFIYPPQVETDNNQVQLVKSMKFTPIKYRTMGKELVTKAQGTQRQLLC